MIDAGQFAPLLEGFSPEIWKGVVRRIPVALTFIAIAILLDRVLRFSFDHLRTRFVAGAPMLYIVERLGGYLIITIGVLAAITTLGVNLSSLAIFGGAVGVGVGLGLQGVVKEFVSGVVLIFDPNVQVGDFVEVEGGVRGEIVEIGPRATRLRTNDDLDVMIPNSGLMQTRVTNWTLNATSRRMHVPFAVAEESDPVQVRKIALAAAQALPFTLPDIEGRRTQVWLTGFSGAGLEFDLVVWPAADSARHPRTMHAAYTWAIYGALRAAGIDNANDQLDVSLRNLFGREGDAAPQALGVPTASRAPRRRRTTASRANDAADAVVADVARAAREQAENPSRRTSEPSDGATSRASPPSPTGA
jgi:small-conductance mechanosensitive channel